MTTATKMMPPEVVNNTFFEHRVPISKMFVHFRTEPDGYARPTRPHRVNKLVLEWDARKMLPIILSMRSDGNFAIIDGAHRVAGAKMVGNETLPAYVYIDLTVQEEAGLYRAFGDYMAQTPLDKWHAAIAEQQPEYLVLANILLKHGLHVPNSKGNEGTGRVLAVDAILSVARQHGPMLLDETLGILKDAWDSTPRAVSAISLRGMSAFMARYHKHANFDRTTFVRRLSSAGVDAVERDAKNLQTGTIANSNAEGAFGRALVAIHDARKVRKLGEWQGKIYSDAQKAQSTERLRAMQRNSSPEQRSAQAKKAAETRFGRLAIDMTCPRCGATPGKPCRNDKGNVVDYRHQARIDAARA
jgi:Family of unknown function (DUF6551)